MAETGKSFHKPINWTKTSDVFYPYEATVEGKQWKLRLNDFPEESLYTLMINDEEILEFDDMISVEVLRRKYS